MMGKSAQTMWVSLEVHWFRILASVRRDMLRCYGGVTSEMWFSEDEYNVQNVPSATWQFNYFNLLTFLDLSILCSQRKDRFFSTYIHSRDTNKRPGS